MHRVFAFDRSPAYRRLFGAALAAAMLAVAVQHCALDGRKVHQTAFVLMVVAVGWRTGKVVEARVKDATLRLRVRDLARKGTCRFCTFLF